MSALEGTAAIDPKHYTQQDTPRRKRRSRRSIANMEVIDVIERFDLGFHRGNVVKYIIRAGKKDPLKELEDLLKAQWYLTRLIKSTEEARDAPQED